MPIATPSLAALSNELADLVVATSQSVVEVQSHRSLASGFIWRDGLVVTPDETLAEDGTIQVETFDGAVSEAGLVGRDPATDIALLRVEGLAPGTTSTGDGEARVGSLALVVAAADSAPLVALGAIASVGPAWRSMRSGTIDARIELDLRLRGRAEGGLAIGGGGGAIGMAVRGPRGRTLVIPTATIDRVAGQLLEHGRVPLAYLGAGLQDVPLEGGGRAAIIMTIDRDGPAAAAGLRQGDLIVTWAGEPIAHVGALLRTLRGAAVGSTVSLGYRRGGEAGAAAVTLGDRPHR